MSEDMERTLPPESSGLDPFSFGPWWYKGKQILRMLGIALLTVAALGLVSVLYLKSRPLPPPDIPLTTRIYDVHGQLIDRLDRGEQRDPIRLEQMPRHLIQATLAAEDQQFYHHWGFSPRGILRAAWVNIRNGRVSQGASTITQQLARNLYLTHDRTWSRKWKEAALTTQLELHFSKDEILEMYLNKIYYGHGAYGIQRAARVYFGKEAKDLNLSESALLAGIPRGPRWYSPLEHPRRAKQRQEAILAAMARKGMITRKVAEKAKAQPLGFADPPRPSPSRAPYFRDYVIRTAVNRWGLDENWVRHGGLKIHTTLDLNIQQKAEQAIQRYLGPRKDLQGALISVEPRTGYIRAMVGGKDYTRSQYNRVFGKRQPGSTFKPVLYLAALQNGLTPVTRFESTPTRFSYEGGTYQPTNYHDRYANRLITMREAIATSDNIYAVRTHLLIGREKAVETARKMGIRSPLKAVPSLALGTGAVSPFEMVQVYATLAGGGLHAEPVGILRIEDSKGEIIGKATPRPAQTVPAPAVYVLTRMLQGVFEPGGTAHRVKQFIPGLSVAGKTGSTEWDSWLSGYTPDLATTVWVGYDQGKRLPPGVSRQTHNIWGTFMGKSVSGKRNRSFHPPSGVREVRVDPDTGYLATDRCPKSVKETFIQGTEPTLTCPVHPAAPTGSDKSPSLWERFKKWWSG